jgi:integrase
MLFVPKKCSKPKRDLMTIQDVRKAITSLALRERLVFKLATIAGLRPGEIFGLKRARVLDEGIEIRQRVYRGRTDTPKTERSVRFVASAATLREDMEAWLERCSTAGPDAWLFPSERLQPQSRRTTSCFDICDRHSLPSDWDGQISKSCVEPTLR